MPLLAAVVEVPVQFSCHSFLIPFQSHFIPRTRADDWTARLSAGSRPSAAFGRWLLVISARTAAGDEMGILPAPGLRLLDLQEITTSVSPKRCSPSRVAPIISGHPATASGALSRFQASVGRTPCDHRTYFYPNHQQAATLWYHDHALGITRLNLYAGLSGFYLLRDQQERTLNLPSGPYEICLVIQDRTLDEQGQLLYTPTNEDGSPLPEGEWGPELFGNLPVVNGAIYPYLEVEPGLYRLRILNASNSRFFHLYFNLAKTPQDIASLVPFYQIGSDGGLLPQSVKLEKLSIDPAERADLVVDFSAANGKTLTLTNDARCPFPGVAGARWSTRGSP
jgi:FtsP/CotA-like multicopper oxidase with cupredoxin domain